MTEETKRSASSETPLPEDGHTLPGSPTKQAAVSASALGNGPTDDPFNLNPRLKPEAEIATLRKRRKKDLAKYYERQNELIEASLKPMAQHTSEGEDAKEQARIPVRIAIWASLLANIALSAIQLYAAISSLSLSFFATALDSVFDPVSNVLLYYLHRKARSLDRTRWPVGGIRLETISNIIYGSLMAAVNLVIIVESARSIIEHEQSNSGSETNDFHVPSVIAVGTALGTKLLLFLYCFTLRKSSSQVQVLWEDHRNDIAVCAFGLLTSTGGSKLKWFIDPMGAIIIGACITISWAYRIYREFELLAGKSADKDFTQVIIYKALTFDKEVKGVDTVRAYHSGPKYFVEIDLILSPTLPLREAHDIGQKLQDEIEILPGVDRAFVHLDWEGVHQIEHRGAALSEKKKEKEQV